MMRERKMQHLLASAAVLLLLLPASLLAQKDDDDDDDAVPVNAQVLPNLDQVLTPLAPKRSRFEALNPNLPDNPNYLAGQAVTTVTSPDKRTLLILTSGYNLFQYPDGPNAGAQNNADSNEYVFVYDISQNAPVKTQVVQVPNTYNGIIFDPNGESFYVSGGVNDNVHIYSRGASGQFAEAAGSPVALGHKAGNGIAQTPAAAGIAITENGRRLVVADYYNDSISILTRTGETWAKTGELDLRPGKLNVAQKGVPGGEYPFWVSIMGNDTAYISSEREREIVVVNLAGSTPAVVDRIKLKGQPNKMTLNVEQTRLYVAEDQTDSVAVINTRNNRLREEIPVGTPAGLLPTNRANLKGSNTNSVTLSPDESTLYVTNGNFNNVAVVALSGSIGLSHVAGLIPTGWYPNSVSLSANGKQMYVVNGKSPTGPNPGNLHGLTPALATQSAASNQYDLQLIKAGFQSFPTPGPAELNRLTELVADNNHFQRRVSAGDQQTMQFLHNNIKHVIYIIKENRTYDQVLGDLEVGNGDPSLTEFGKTVTPNLHRLARKFVTLDNFYDSSEVSMDGWPWSTSARAPDVVEKQTPVNYAGRGVSYDSEGDNRNVNVGLATLAERQAADPVTPSDPDLLPGTADVAAPDSPTGVQNQGYIWDAALRSGLTVRNYGFFIDLVPYAIPVAAGGTPLTLDPFSAKVKVASETNTALLSRTDPYYRGFDQRFPDYYRFQEFKRDLQANGLAQLTLLRLAHDHTGSFGAALLGVNTPELQVADNDYAVGLVAETIAKSQYKDDTLIFVIEDDAQDGADHVDAHRSTAFIIGPYVKRQAVVSTAYNTVNFVRTMEDVLGIGRLNLNDAVAVPMAEVFDTRRAAAEWAFNAAPSPMLYTTQLPLPSREGVAPAKLMLPTHSAAYWEAATKGLNFNEEDRLDGAAYNRILWTGLKGSVPYTPEPTGANLRLNRAELLARFFGKQGTQSAKVTGAKAAGVAGAGATGTGTKTPVQANGGE